MTNARKYFSDELSPYFRWSDRGRELCWCNGTTIAFHEEITAVLDRLSDQKLPDFSTLSLSLATLRNSWTKIAAQLSNAVTALRSFPEAYVRLPMDAHKDILDAWPEAIRRLTLLNQYTEAHSVSLPQRTELLAVLLRGVTIHFDAAVQKELATAFGAGLPEDWFTSPNRYSSLDVLKLPESVDEARLSASKMIVQMALPQILQMVRIAKRLAALIPCETVEELDRLMTTGIVDDVRAPDATLLDQRRQTRGLLNQLSKDRELRGFSRLARQLTAALTLPRPLSEPDELQMGGISDITNRGDLDRLLLSELAHDDLTLSVRLGLNEALYLRRESPPSPQSRTRCVLVDLSLPLWGIPGLYAAAAAMALHATSDKHIRIQCFRSSRTGVVKSELTTRDGLHEHLSALEPAADPTASLEPFFRAVRDESLSAEPVLITTGDVLQSDVFRQSLDKVCPGDLWLIVVERDGRLKVLQKTRQGTSVRKQLALPLEEILSPETASRVRRKDLQDNLPAIFRLAQFPLLLSHQTRPDRLWAWGDSAVAVSDDGRLMHWNKGTGARQLAAGLSVNSETPIHIIHQRNPLFLFQLLICPNDSETGTLATIDDGGATVILEQTHHGLKNVSDVWCGENAILVFGVDAQSVETCSAIHRLSGELLGTRKIGDELFLRHGRCGLTHEDGFCVLNWVGGHSAWILQKLPPGFQGHRRIMETVSGSYLALSKNSELVDPLNPGRFGTLNAQMRSEGVRFEHFAGISSDGKHIAIAHQSRMPSDAADRTVKVPAGCDTPGKTVVQVKNARRIRAGSIAAIEYAQASMFVRQNTPHFRFSRIAIDDGRLLLKDSNGRLFQITWHRRHHTIRLDPAPSMAATLQFVEFEEVLRASRNDQSAPAVGYTLQKAEWGNGCQAWLDSRGLLHLKSAIRANPEVALVMRDGGMSGWLSSGELFGDDYHCGKDPSANGLRRVTPETAWNSGIKPFIDSVPWNFLFTSDTTQTGNTMLPEY